MGGQQSKEELLYQQVNYGNIEGIKSLRNEGAGLEWIDKEGKTPLMLACMRPDLLDVAKLLIELGANVNAYRPGSHAGTPLHHASKKGLDQTVNLLLSNGANPLVMNDDCQTPLDLARAKRHCNVVRAIESRICLFCGWLRELYGPSILEAFAPQWVQRKVWAVVLPSDSRNPTAPTKFELALYSDLQVAQPRVTIALSTVHIEEPKFNQADPTLIIVDKASSNYEGPRTRGRSHHPRRHGHHGRKKFTSLHSFETRYKFLSAYEGDKQQLLLFYNACRGISQQSNYLPVAPLGAAPMPNPSHSSLNAPATSTPSLPPIPGDSQMSITINASIPSALAEGVPVPTRPVNLTADTDGCGPSSQNTSYSGWGQTSRAVPPAKLEPVPDPYSGCSGIGPSSSSTQLHAQAILPLGHEGPPAVSAPSAPPVIEETFYDGPIQYPTIDSSPIDLPAPLAAEGKPEPPADSKEGSNSSSDAPSSCVICLDAPAVGACIPCGHMAGCMPCLNEIKAKKWGCPVCRAKIDQVVRLYTV